MPKPATAQSTSRHSKMGSPREHGERVPLGLRVTKETKARLDEAAKATGRSQSQEAELRLESTFNAINAVHDALDLAYGRRFTGLLLALAQVAQTTGTRSVFLSQWNGNGGEEWVLDPFAYDQAVRAINTILEAARPKGQIVEPPNVFRLPAHAIQALGQGFAEELLSAVADPALGRLSEDIAAPIRQRIAGLISSVASKPRKSGKAG